MSGFGPKTANTFSSSAVPSHYVAGVGRGAMGFTTRSDIGPARPAVGADPTFGQAPAGYVAGRGRGMGELARDQGELSQKHVQQDLDRADYSESNWNEFAGYGEKLFSAGTPYEEDDAEADQIYDLVDDFMEGRHKRRREQQMLEDQKNKKNIRPKIADQFADLKRELSTVSVEQWDAIPEVGDYSLKLKQKTKKEMYTPLPDYLIESASQRSGVYTNTLDPTLQRQGGFDTPSGMQTVTGLAEARGTVLSLKLDKMSDSVSGQTVVDPKGYLTDLNSLKISSDAEIGDFKKARTLLSSVTSTNPKHAPGWIAAARVEELAGKMVQARKIIRQGCEICPDSEDIWMEAARLHSTENAKAILANAVRHLPTSVNIWLHAADLEQSEQQKKVVLRRALEFVPNSVKLWQTVIEMESLTDARILLARAVECVPHSVEMWLALAKIETHENARKVLNQAREAIPTEHATWIAASKLEEAHGNLQMIGRIIEKMLQSLSQYQVVISREQWIKEAEAAEHSAAVHTAAAIIRNTLHLGVEEEDRKVTWMDDAESCLSQDPPAKETARAIYALALENFPAKKSLWLAAASLEKEHGTAASLEEMLKAAVKHCPRAEILWLMAAKEKWLAGEVPSARAILKEAFDANPQSEEIWLAAVKLEWENNEHQRARFLLTKARDSSPSARVWLKSALLEREMGDVEKALALLEEGIRKYPTYAKFYIMAGQICSRTFGPGIDDLGRAREFYQKGLQQCPDHAALWIQAIRLEETARGTTKARSMAEMARLRLAANDEIWLESIRIERRSGNEKLAETNMAKAIRECPSSGILWAEDLTTCPKPAQKQKSVDALKKCDNNPNVILAVGRLFEKDKKTAKARKWYERAASLNPKLGDCWAYWYCFELHQAAATGDAVRGGKGDGGEGDREDPAASPASGPAQLAETVLAKCVTAAPNRGEVWLATAKQTEYRRADPGTVLKKVVEGLLAGAGP